MCISYTLHVLMCFLFCFFTFVYMSCKTVWIGVFKEAMWSVYVKVYQSFHLFTLSYSFNCRNTHKIHTQFWSPFVSQEAPLWLPVSVGTIPVLCHTWREGFASIFVIKRQTVNKQGTIELLWCVQHALLSPALLALACVKLSAPEKTNCGFVGFSAIHCFLYI